MRNGDKYGAQLQVHPNLDRKEWQQKFVLRPKSSNKPFPINIDIGVLKWRLQLASEEDVPLAINCWPNENPDGCTVNIEYTLQAEHLVLNNVIIVIPLPPATPPVVSECEGTYEYVKSKSQLLWCIELVDEANKTGSMEFSVPNGHSDHFFPVSVRFSSKNLFCDITPQSVHVIGSDESEEFSSESRFYTEKFEII
ncbi:hypothetical protein AB6A40_010948 [Gnathostoma spinigerum]|uniref:Coatomer subunit delta n=1 Tax=Gnathostoma spinigerum TaxID=75299 RepID=A0ABD6EWA9_9BILA